MVIACITRRLDGVGNIVAAVGVRLDPAGGVELPAGPAVARVGFGVDDVAPGREREVAELLGIPDGVTQVAMFPVAYTTGHGFKPAARPPVEQIVSWDGWDLD